MSVNATNTIFSTRFNFLKIFTEGNGTFSVAPGVFFPTDPPVEILLATHNLGYVPRGRVWYEPIAGQLWPLSPQQYSNSDGGPGTTLTVTGDFYLTSTQLYVRMANPGIAKNITFYWRIYADE